MTQTIMRLYCNVCGARFTTAETTRRVCSRDCTVNLRRMAPVPQHARRQSEILDALRATPGEWISGAALARRVFGNDERPSVVALRVTLNRLAHRPDLPGIVIEQRRAAVPVASRSLREYRLVRDDGLPTVVGLVGQRAAS